MTIEYNKEEFDEFRDLVEAGESRPSLWSTIRPTKAAGVPG